MKLKFFYLCLFSIFLVSCASNSEDVQAATIAAQTLTQQAITQPNSTAQPSQQGQAEQGAEATAAPTQTEESTYVQGIPGLNVSDLMKILVEFGFDCTQEEIQGDSLVMKCNFESPEYQYVITFWGDTAEAVNLIEAIAYYYGDLDYSDLTSIIFGMIAEISYVDATPENASTWIQQTIPSIQIIGDEAISNFGGIRYHLYAFPSAQVLEIGNPQD
jgi:hypothetical protein